MLRTLGVLLCLVLLASPTSVSAHKVKMFASAEGNVITGYVYYTTGGKPKQAGVLVQDPHGNKLGEVSTNENGEFTFSAETRQDHLFILELADGHRTTFTVKADELPESLKGVASEITGSERSNEAVVPQKEDTSGTSIDSSTTQQTIRQFSAEEFESIVNNAVSKQLRPLREQLEQYEEKIRLHDILGGIGYIVGLMGLGYYLHSRKIR